MPVLCIFKVRKAKRLSKYFWADNSCCCNIHSIMPKDEGFIVTLIWVWISALSICCGNLGKLLNLSEPLCLPLHMGTAIPSEILCNEFLVRPEEEGRHFMKNRVGTTPWLGFRGWNSVPGHECVDFFLVFISYSPRVGFLSLLLFPLWISFSLFDWASLLCLPASAYLHLWLTPALNSLRPIKASLASYLSTFVFCS